MKKALKSLLFAAMFVFVGSAFGFAADDTPTYTQLGAKKVQIDADALAKKTANATSQIAYKGPVTQASPAQNPPHPDDPTGTLPDVPNRARCQNWNYEGENIRPVSGGPTSYQCPPGYKCHKNGILIECRWSGQSHEAPSIDNYFCRTENC